MTCAFHCVCLDGPVSWSWSVERGNATWLILPVVICLSQRLSHACDFGPIMLAFGIGVMINRDSRGHSYFIVRGEILGFMKDEQLRKHLPRMFSLIKNESWGLEDDQIPS
ncbi:unnamed protein product [Linum tenue]|nr:unnamed protein product [Linum tenue]